MQWLERFGFFGAGVLTTAGVFWIVGSLVIGGDFAPNAAGATIGGLISVGLAILMFNHKRHISARDAANTATQQRSQAIREALRYVRAIYECVQGTQVLTINNSDRILMSLTQASDLATKALSDPSMTDFRLRLTMNDAATIGHNVTNRMLHEVRSTQMDDANTHFTTTDDIRRMVSKRLNN